MTAMTFRTNSTVVAAQSALADAGAADFPGSRWAQLALALDAALHRPDASPDWLYDVLQVRAQARVLAARDMDAALLHCLHALAAEGGCSLGMQALCRMLVATEMARRLGYGATLVAHLERAALALSLPLPMLRQRMGRVVAVRHGESVRDLVQRYADNALELGLDGGDGDPLWVETVRQYGAAAPQALPPLFMTSAQHLAVLLGCVQRFCSRMGLARHMPATSLQAAHGEGAARGGGLDTLGAALVQAVGLYPPGCLVRLQSGEAGMVVARGQRADQPLVAVFAEWSDGRFVPMPPRLCDSAQVGRAVLGQPGASQLPPQPALQALLRQVQPAKGAGPHQPARTVGL